MTDSKEDMIAHFVSRGMSVEDATNDVDIYFGSAEWPPCQRPTSAHKIPINRIAPYVKENINV